MKNLLVSNYKVIKVFNNNVLLVNQDGAEKILFCKGIGFGKHTGDIIPLKTPVDKIFAIENKDNFNNFKELISHTDSKIVGLCEEVISMISDKLEEQLNEKIHISLIDHISYTLKRLMENDEIENPFLVETETLYKKEFEIAKKAVNMLEDRLNIIIPDGEVGFITLHIHSARNQGKLSNTLKYTFLSNTIIEFIEDELNIEIDKQSLDYARFLTHIRFAIERILNDTPIKNDLLPTIKKQYAKSYKLAKKVSKILEDELYAKVVDDETAYLAIHIEKFMNSCNK
ncbi:transcriptional antiterminator [Clostridium tetanomorphum]|uniref:PRD domain-containing protein n=1 Tax=Clostridium tetanomorphum TaxID=1553 RepID=A0A923EDD0_CLOTT|nr:PRD domain-containing protein [Clostridium tetanomorphum]KAJ53022.1 BglG family transcriptional antiterminator [Clostridium tetanomorphum DSM 665]MBC2398555.1 PRD domain-containing protein [Clostridium tetanomorphum]MBP1864965.1 transcriptional antiterminator [Clostridium tetanomorphum]NRS83171.1 transcriptional antiterminator [Clostridium tetanomorphum]NRZ98728.1 transcriptional antiterminator [Clostridium tetanomorphum]